MQMHSARSADAMRLQCIGNAYSKTEYQDHEGSTTTVESYRRQPRRPVDPSRETAWPD